MLYNYRYQENMIICKLDIEQIPFYNRLEGDSMLYTHATMFSLLHALFLLSTFTTDEKRLGEQGRIRELEQEEGSPTQLIDLLIFFPESDFFGFHFSPFTYIYHKEDLGFHSSAMGENPRLLLRTILYLLCGFHSFLHRANEQ
ncbi:hypothetical protein ACJX0J_001826, partial (mitochondrion) [Zea mays]